MDISGGASCLQRKHSDCRGPLNPLPPSLSPCFRSMPSAPVQRPVNTGQVATRDTHPLLLLLPCSHPHQPSARSQSTTRTKMRALPLEATRSHERRRPSPARIIDPAIVRPHRRQIETHGPILGASPCRLPIHHDQPPDVGGVPILASPHYSLFD